MASAISRLFTGSTCHAMKSKEKRNEVTYAQKDCVM
jgi:hypothetical protein